MVTKEQILEKLRDIRDPELPLNIVDLGLVYEVLIDEENNVKIKMTFTSPGCPVGASFIVGVKKKTGEIEGVKSVDVDVVWDPPWSPERMTEEAKLELGLT